MFLTWDECKKQVMGYPGAIYKSFGTEEEAKEYLGIAVAADDMQGGDPSAGAVEIYVDGSYHAGTKEFSYGMVVLINGKEEKFSQKMSDPAYGYGVCPFDNFSRRIPANEGECTYRQSGYS